MEQAMIHGTMAGHDGIGYSADSPILDLAVAIVKAAVDDYVKTLRNLWNRNLDINRKRKLIIEKTMLEEFFHSSWYEMLTDIDPDFLIYQCKILAKEKEKKAIERKNMKRIKQKIKQLRDGAGEHKSKI